MWVATQAPHEHRAFCARLLGIPEHRVRAIARDTGGGFGQKILVQREEMCIMLAATKLPAAVKWIEDRRENLMAAGWSRHEHGRRPHGLRRRRADPGRAHRLRVGRRRVSHAVAGDAGDDRSASSSPGPYRVPAAGFRLRSVYTNTAGRSGYRGPWQYETLAREVVLEIAARQMGIDPVELRRRNLLRLDEMPYTNPNGMRVRLRRARSRRSSTPSTMLDYEAFRAEQARARRRGGYLGVGFSNYIEPTTPVFGIFATEGATIRIEPTGKVNVYVAGGSSGNSLETTVVQLTADALGVDIDDVNTIQGDTALTGFGAGTGGSRSGAMLAGAIGETAGGSASADRRDRRPPARGRRRRHRGGARLGARARARRRRGSPSPRSPPSPYFSPGVAAAGDVPPGLEASGRFTPTARSNWANATHVCTCEVDVATGQVTLLRYIVSEDCGADDQPERGRGPDRRRHGAGHRRRAARAHGLRRRRQPAGHDVRRLPAADRHRGARRSSTATSRPRADARRLQGRRRGRRDRRAARGRERRERRARAARRDPHPAAADAGKHPRTDHDRVRRDATQQRNCSTPRW